MSAALKWFKSSYSTEEPGEVCVEVATEPSAIHIRDSKVTDGPVLTVTPATWRAFVATARDASN
ncbi:MULTISPECIES: DUF397 domain-containing protein [Streptomyces]|uniref:DUF397 domain-containing protein n=1 Tax=Streptomyces tsukubensis (strain DSM 42081 / NBRC 108919 / NRRL 18488 / 9993) TaxID=1114943 RepID=I2N3W0_STRT9|nr:MULTISPECIES: DUF397 domain-containing protein [Streptomyces]AZK95780.1 DUF397 domain-containing protein [Streptomyces tsukubensis]EIF91707.1 hypothetical protein [Streptomyces tsukubensis NRRL18488]MYS65652.1 DUF397 domain-containing protein [Streptomyces sp. SID5473]QKM68194.1 DUF397 domain-containing protein [Streptomyces tsukubensis NRRL18488]TAI44596.1 DUF397 domain-containing protein [Streptomyces tsukubensis]